jgi:hypothetical protein
MAIALYAHDESTPAVASITGGDPSGGGGSGIDASVLLAMLLSEVRSEFGTASRGLDAALAGVARARSTADQLVAAEAAGLAKQAEQAASWVTAGPKAPATTSSSTTGPHNPTASTAKVSRPVPAVRSPSPPILGPSMLSPSELAAWYVDGGHQAQLTVPIAALAGFYQSSGAALGVRDDIAFAQAVLETGFFSFPPGGQVAPTDNNFAGIGACDTCAHGSHFSDAKTGVAAQLQLLHDYASPQPAPGPLPGPIGEVGCCQTWMQLTGVWATASDYGYNILSVYRQMLEWALPRRRSAAGL